MVHKKDSRVYRRYWQLIAAVICFLIALLILAFWFAPVNATDIGTKAAPNDYQWSIYWGETGHILCYESAAAKEQGQPPAGILNFDVTGSDVVTITCRQPGTSAELSGGE